MAPPACLALSHLSLPSLKFFSAKRFDRRLHISLDDARVLFHTSRVSRVHRIR